MLKVLHKVKLIKNEKKRRRNKNVEEKTIKMWAKFCGIHNQIRTKKKKKQTYEPAKINCCVYIY